MVTVKIMNGVMATAYSTSQNIPLYESVNFRKNQARIGYGTVKEDVPYWASVFFVRVRSVTYEVVWSE
jgi:hypothetical protein